MKKKSAPKSVSTDVPLLVPGYKQFGGRQVEAAALRNVLAHLGIVAPHTGEPFTDALLFGLGGGIGLSYFVYASGDFTSLFLATRITTSPTGFVETMCTRIGAKATIQTASTPAAAEKKLKQALAEGRPPILWVDPGGLPYYGTPAAYHTLVVYGFDESLDEVHIADRSDRPITLTHAELTRARQSGDVRKFPALLVDTPRPIRLPALKTAVTQGLRDCCGQMQKGFGPANFRSNFGLKALEKWAGLLINPKDPRGWPKFFPRGPKLYQALVSVFDQVENRGSGGSAFRELYADFLVEAEEILSKPKFDGVAKQFRESARLWGALSAALLPDEVPLFKETKQLTVKKRLLFEKEGAAARDEAKTLSARLEGIRVQVEKTFPMSEAEVQDLLTDVRQHVLAIHAVEKQAVKTLESLIG